MKSKKLFIILIILSCLKNITLASEIKIKVKIENEIITNIDIENEENYLFFLNPKLKQLSNKDSKNIAKNSLIKEIIKKKELKKYFDIKKKYKFVDKIEKNLLLKKNINNKKEFIQLLEMNNLNYSHVRKKLKMEALWNQVIYKKYFNNLKIDKEKLKIRILNQKKNMKKKYEYNLSEIVFEIKTNENTQQIFNKINNSIKRIGFENTANIFSLSDTSNNGGLIGWINELQISDKINKELSSLNIDEVTNPIKIPNGYLVIKINDKKTFNQKFDVEKQLNNLIDIETNKQLNNFSMIFYKRLKQNTVINEY